MLAHKRAHKPRVSPTAAFTDDVGPVSQGASTHPTVALQRLIGNRATSALSGGTLQRWRAGAIDNETTPGSNPQLRQFINNKGLKKGGGIETGNLSEMTDFNTLHHMISKDTLGTTLAPALKNGVNSQTVAIRTEAVKFLDKVKEVTPFHEDILGDPPVYSEPKFKTLLQNMPLNFELGYQNPVANAGTTFDSQVVKTGTENGISTYEATPLSKALKKLNDMLETLPKNPAAAQWTQLTTVLGEAIAAYDETDRLDDLLMKPDLEQWDTFNGKAQKKVEGQNIDDVEAAFTYAENSYATTPNKEDVSALPTAWVLDIDDYTNDELDYEGMIFTVNLKHIAERHVMKYFQFNATSRNTFFSPDEVYDQPTLEAKIEQILRDVFVPLISDDVAGPNAIAGETKTGDFYAQIEVDFKDHATTAGKQSVHVAINTLAPEANCVHVTQPKIEAFVAGK
jgi:hypothetical protein